MEPIKWEQTRLRHPFTMIVSGSTGSGKSVWIQRLLSHLPYMVGGGGIGCVLYCYGEVNNHILEMQRRGMVGNARVQVHKGIPRGGEEFIREKANQMRNGHLLVVLDDLMVGMEQPFLDALFTKGSHNWGVSVILVTQHLFSRELRVARNNAHYLVLMRNPAGALQVRNLAVQLFPGQSAYFMQAYRDATKDNFGYLLVDMHPSTPNILRLRAYIYPDDERPMTVYVAK